MGAGGAQAVGVDRGDPGFVVLAGADRRVELVVIRYIIAMQAVRAGFEIRRGITIADAKRIEIVGDRLRVPEGKVAVKL